MAVGSNIDIAKAIVFGDNSDGTAEVINKVLRGSGIYTRDEIMDLKYNKFSRFGTAIDPYGAMPNVVEYLFFVKPDLHILDTNTLQLNSELSSEPFFMDLYERYPDVIRQLQSSAYKDISKQPFSTLLSHAVSGTLDLPEVTLNTMDNPSTIYGTSYDYLQDGEQSDEKFDFSLEFLDSKYLEVYHFFKAYAEYQKLKKYGKVTPPDINKYVVNKVLHNTMGIYKFLVSTDDFSTIVHYSYIWGVMPISVPRNAFGDNSYTDGLKYSISFKSAFIEDMDPLILVDFNNLTKGLWDGLGEAGNVPIYDTTNKFINGDFVKCAHVVTDTTPGIDYNGKLKYKLIWRK